MVREIGVRSLHTFTPIITFNPHFPNEKQNLSTFSQSTASLICNLVL